MGEFLRQEYWGNSILDYLIASGGIILAWGILKVIRGRIISLLKRLAKRTDTSFDDLLIKAVDKFLIPYIYLLANYTILNQLNLSERAANILSVALIFVSTYFAIRLVNFLVHGAVIVYMEQKEEPPERVKQLSGILVVVKVMTWGFGIVMMIDNLGYDVTAIIAGLGVGGIAIALAAQSILSDLFSYLVIFFDKPFEVGDFIVTGNNSGVVEKIGIKTSHIRSLDGQQMVMPNAEMVKTVIHNFKRLERRRIVFPVGVVYYTPASRLKKIPEMIRQIIDKNEMATFDRTHLKEFGDFSVNYEIVYYVESPDYQVYMDTHHAICVSIFEKFEQEGIEFAFPTQTVFLNHQNATAETSLQ